MWRKLFLGVERRCFWKGGFRVSSEFSIVLSYF